jgi:hypothetical protein
VTVTAHSFAPNDIATPRAYSAAFNECSEPSIATIIFKNFEFSADNLVLSKYTKGLIKMNLAARQNVSLRST